MPQSSKSVLTKSAPIKTASALVNFTDKIQALVATQGCYLSDQLYSFDLDNGQFSLKKNNVENKVTSRWLILGREHYFETSKDYPIANKRDVTKALLFDDNKAPFNGITLKHIERINEQSHRVTFWVINPETLEKLPNRPIAIFPESYLLAKGLTKNISLAMVETINKTLFLSKTAQGLLSGIKSPQTPTVEMFAFSTGSALTEKQYNHVPSSNFTSLLYQGLTALNLVAVQGFFLPSKKINWQHYPWQQAGIVSIVALSLYLALTSGWLLYKQFSLDYTLVDNRTSVNQALAIQKKYKNQQQWHTQLTAPIELQQPYWNVFQALIDSIAVGTTIKSVTFKGNKITIQGAANTGIRATDVLVKLNDNPFIDQPTFSKPVRKHRNKEQFTITFTLNNKIFTDDLITTKADDLINTKENALVDHKNEANFAQINNQQTTTAVGGTNAASN